MRRVKGIQLEMFCINKFHFCLGSLDVALRALDGVVGMALYWCLAHQGGAHDG